MLLAVSTAEAQDSPEAMAAALPGILAGLRRSLDGVMAATEAANGFADTYRRQGMGSRGTVACVADVGGWGAVLHAMVRVVAAVQAVPTAAVHCCGPWQDHACPCLFCCLPPDVRRPDCVARLHMHVHMGGGSGFGASGRAEPCACGTSQDEGSCLAGSRTRALHAIHTGETWSKQVPQWQHMAAGAAGRPAALLIQGFPACCCSPARPCP